MMTVCENIFYMKIFLGYKNYRIYSNRMAGHSIFQSPSKGPFY